MNHYHFSTYLLLLLSILTTSATLTNEGPAITASAGTASASTAAITPGPIAVTTIERKLKKKKMRGRKFSKKGYKTCKPKHQYNPPQRCKGGPDTKYEPKVIPPAGSATDDPTFAAAAFRCVSALLISGFNFLDTERSNEWFDDDSIMYLKETGYYVGAASISEYVMFVKSDLFEYYYSPVPLDLFPLVADGDTCVITIVLVNSMKTKQEYSSLVGGVSMDAVVGFRTSFQITSPDLSTVKVDNMHLYYPPGFLKFLFGDVLSIGSVARRNCNILKTRCSDTFYNKNCYDEVQECINDLMALPVTDGDNIDGKTLGCRTLHADFAAINDEHCPHISFVPRYDVNCFSKCQETSNYTLADVFHPVELDVFDEYATSVGLGGDQFISPSIFGAPS